jgi:tRNA-Thr(GGU) m(6)t(6)A37 methyltransferase TsaA
VQNIIELEKHRNFEVALRDLETFSHIWIISWFDRNTTWRPAVMPPRGAATKRGVFATRSPHRPNPIGMTVVPLLGIKDLRIFVGDVDLLDGTPVMDIKPYVSSVDSVPDANLGWIRSVEEEYAAPPAYTVRLDDLAARQLTWLQEQCGIDLLTRGGELLSRDPTPHRTRRIRKLAGNRFEIGCGTWRLQYQIDHHEVVIQRVYSGYSCDLVFGEVSPLVQEQEAHVLFLTEWGAVGTMASPQASNV